MIYLHEDDRTKVAAIRHLLAHSALANCTEVIELHGIPAVRLTQPAHTLSSGESVLWEFARSVANEGPGPSMFTAKGELDDHSRRVMHEALGLWFGVEAGASA